MDDLPAYPGTPRWVKVSGIVAALLALLLAAVIFAGTEGHGPGRHLSSGHAGSEGLILLGVLVVAGIALNWGWLADRGVFRPRPRVFPVSLPLMAPRLRRLALVAHVTASVGSLGAVLVFLVLAVAGLTSQDAQTVRAAYVANGLIAWFVIAPLIFAALATGLVQALGTEWGLIRHYWVLAKFLLTVVTFVILLNQMDGISHIAAAAAETALSSADLLGLRRSLRLHAAGGLVVLLAIVALSIYKPRGTTRHGWRRQHEPRKLPGR